MLCDTRKKLLFRAWHRGTRESDLLMGRFAEAYLPECTDDEVALFDALLAENDPDIYDWLTARAPLANPVYRPLIERMITFYKLAA